jgi:hypothetical protein
VDVPILVPIQKSREDAVQVCACADEKEDDEEERLELEDAELDGWFMWLVCEDLEFLRGREWYHCDRVSLKYTLRV